MLTLNSMHHRHSLKFRDAVGTTPRDLRSAPLATLSGLVGVAEAAAPRWGAAARSRVFRRLFG